MENRNEDSVQNGRRLARSDSHDSQTASEFINSQLQLEADAREALPYAFDHCTQPLGPLRQNVFSCLTCNPPPKSTSDPYTSAGVCYSCSIACHGEHELVELFNKRNFTCDCGTTRLPATSPCTLRLDPVTGIKGPVHSQPAAEGNTYNQNFKNRFCGCEELYDPHTEKGTMFQCFGLAGESEGGCGEDWWHPECIIGHGRTRLRAKKTEPLPESTHESLGNGSEPTPNQDEEEEDPGEEELPPGFPAEDDFETFVCYKCVDANPWIKRYASSTGFLPPVLKSEEKTSNDRSEIGDNRSGNETTGTAVTHQETMHDASLDKTDPGTKTITTPPDNSLKRRAEDDEDSHDPTQSKKAKTETNQNCYYKSLLEPGDETFSLFLKEDFRDHFCRCANCYPNLRKHPQLLEEEESYEPPLSEEEENGRGSVGTGSLLDRGEAALNNVDRVRAIEGVMVYNHLKDKVKSFLQPFAESGQAVGAEDIKAYFEKLRGDEQGIQSAAMAGSGSGNEDNRREQSANMAHLRIRACLLSAAFLAPVTVALGSTSYNGLAKTPPMGWDNWNAYGCDIDADVLLETAEKMVDFGLRDLGYKYVILDDCWQNMQRSPNSSLIANATKFPDGIKAVSDQIHNMGLMFGMYSSAGMYTCAQYPASLGHETINAQTFADWGIDYLKYDNCYNQGQEGTSKLSFDRYNAMSQALNKTGRPIHYGMCNWGKDYPWNWAQPMANSWRMSGDVYDSFDRPDDRCPCTTYDCELPGFHCSIMNIIGKVAPIVDKGQPGAWNDLDALEVGNGGMTDDEYKAHFSMWAMIKSPLIMGTNIPKMTASTYSILANPAVIAISQDSAGTPAVRVWNRKADVDEYDQGSISLWVMALSGGDYAIALLNAGAKELQLNATLEEIFIDKATTAGGATRGPLPSSKGWDIYDLWANRMDDTMASSILQGNATMTGSMMNTTNSTMLYNATETPYADGVKQNNTALLGVKTSSVDAMGTIQATVPRHGIAMYRLRAQAGASMSKRDEL
ncbi:MAG: hypothetical protein LQ339_008470 [Xanthoria mediterranea]|nr:MAG: hypothetical protein LQ339_008470 [Xanthoria mediterranea]